MTDTQPEVEETETPDEPERSVISLSRCDISFMINVREVNGLGEALDVAAASLGRYGMDAFYVLAKDPDTGRSWIISEGNITDAEETLEELRAAQSGD